MDFRSANKLNEMFNCWSGNFYPMTVEKKNLSLSWKLWVLFTWIVSSTYMLTTTMGMFTVTIVEAVRDNAINFVILVEILVLVIYLTSQQHKIRKIIEKMNSILIDSEDLRGCIRDIVNPHKRGLKIYQSLGVISIIFWFTLPLWQIVDGEQQSFTYTDFILPVWYPGAPFTRKTFCSLIVVQIVGGIIPFIKKGGADVYVTYLITLLTAQYCYVRHQIRDTLSEIDDEKSEERVIKSLQKCIKHHIVVVELGVMLGELLGFYVGVTCMYCVLKLCLLSLCVITVPEFSEKLPTITYMIGIVIQVYMVYLCGQQLLDASTSIADEAFHENWYNRGKAVKILYRTIGMGNKATCRLTASGVADLTVPTFSRMINQSYTVLLLLLKLY